jgi:hypothetical protein
MLGFQRKGLQDEQIQRPLRKVDTVRVGHALPFRFYKEHTRSLVEVQGELAREWPPLSIPAFARL